MWRWHPIAAFVWSTSPRLLGIAKSAVTKTVDRLERRGLVTRRREPTNKDRRIVYAGLTPEGARVFAAAQPTFVAAVTQQIAAPLTVDELHQLGRISEKLLSARARSQEDRSPRNGRVLPRGSAGPGATDDRTPDPIGIPAKGKDPH